MPKGAAAVKNLNLDALKDYITNNGIKQANLPREMGYDQSYLSAVLLGKRAMPLPTYKMLCLKLGVDESMFISKDKPTKPDIPAVASVDYTKYFCDLIQQLAYINSSIQELTKAINAQTVIDGQTFGQLEKFVSGMIDPAPIPKPQEPKQQAFIKNKH